MKRIIVFKIKDPQIKAGSRRLAEGLLEFERKYSP